MTGRGAGRPAVTRRAVLAVLVRPRLWVAAVAVSVRLAPTGWWRRWPPVPAPDPAYLRFRMITNYGGDGEAPPAPEDLVQFLDWWRRAERRRG